MFFLDPLGHCQDASHDLQKSAPVPVLGWLPACFMIGSSKPDSHLHLVCCGGEMSKTCRTSTTDGKT